MAISTREGRGGLVFRKAFRCFYDLLVTISGHAENGVSGQVYYYFIFVAIWSFMTDSLRPRYHAKLSWLLFVVCTRLFIFMPLVFL